MFDGDSTPATWSCQGRHRHAHPKARLEIIALETIALAAAGAKPSATICSGKIHRSLNFQLNANVSAPVAGAFAAIG
ncbi:MAG: hypothetical protein AB7G15_10410 [Alphaproteobacteria bacterium]